MNSTTSVNGVEVESLETLVEALNYLQKDYNDGNIWLAEGGEVCCIESRTRTLENHITRVVQNVPQLRFTTISVREGKAYVEVRENRE